MKKNLKIWFLLLFIGVIQLHGWNAVANIYTVTNTADAGAGSLRQAIIDANNNAGLDTIQFSILPAGNLFEGSGSNTYAVIEINTALPTITSPVFIDGSSQTNTNVGSIAGIVVGVDNITQGAFSYPDVYLVPSVTYTFPTNSTGVSGNGLSIDINNVTIRGLAISGFGNTHTNGATASGHADISILRSPTVRVVNNSVSNCFLSCNPVGSFPTLAHRRTKGTAILIGGFNQTGTISGNYIAHPGTFGISFSGNVDNNGVGPAGTTIGNRNWVITSNQLINITTNTTILVNTVHDGVNLMKCVAFRVTNNYITDVEQVGIDLGYNADSNYIANNTITAISKTSGSAPQVGIRIGLCSEKDTLFRNVIFNNTGSEFLGGIWIDRSTLMQTGVVVKDNANNHIEQNHISGNNGSGIILSNNSTGGCFNNVITANSTYNNTGLGIDLNFNGTTGPTTVSVNDDGDIDAGPNNIQNFPVLDSVKQITSTVIAVWGKGPAGSTMEFFITDGQANSHGGVTLSYGEGKTFLQSKVEGGVDDGNAGIGSYNIDGNIANSNVNLFYFNINVPGVLNVDSLTATATLGNNTSEFGPFANIMFALGCDVSGFAASYGDRKVDLHWRAVCDKNFRQFDVEHSVDGIVFKRLATISSASVNELSNYQYVHLNPEFSNNFYRLRMVNGDGNVRYTSVVRVNTGFKPGSGLHVNTIFRDRIDMSLQLKNDEELNVHLFNLAGKLVRYTQVLGKTGFNFIHFDDLYQLPAGNYIIYLKGNNRTFTSRLVKY